MPIYQFTDLETGKVVDFWLPVERRNDVGPRYKRVEVPPRINYLQGKPSETDADVATPKGFRQLEETIPGGYRTIEKQRGFSAEEIKRVWSMCLAFLLVCLSSSAADLTTGYSFFPTETGTATKLNAISGAAGINPNFITGKKL